MCKQIIYNHFQNLTENNNVVCKNTANPLTLKRMVYVE
jgi:hypothetical protein